jgi:hypothetical protein
VRPELFVAASPLIDVWAGEKELTPRQRQAAKRTADAAVRAGLIELTGTERRFETDVLGMLLTGLRSRADHEARGQYYTPAEFCDVMARVLDADAISVIAAEGWHDPSVGTGGMYAPSPTSSAGLASIRRLSNGLEATRTRWRSRASRSTSCCGDSGTTSY